MCYGVNPDVRNGDASSCASGEAEVRGRAVRGQERKGRADRRRRMWQWYRYGCLLTVAVRYGCRGRLAAPVAVAVPLRCC